MNWDWVSRYPRLNLCFGALLSLIISWLSCAQSIIINNDGTLYLRSAEALMSKGWEAAYSIYAWPVYSFLIGWLCQLTGLDPLHSAYWIDASLIALLTVIFMLIGRVLHEGPKYDYLYLFVISLHPTLNEYREFIIRDFGFYAFYLLGLYYLLRANLEQKIFGMFGAATALFVATLFRIEGMIYFILLPLICFGLSTMNWTKRLRFALISTSPLILCFLGLCIAWFLQPDLVSSHLGRLTELSDKFIQLPEWVHQSSVDMINLMKNHVLNRYAAPDAGWIIIGGMTVYYFKVLLFTFNIIYAWLCYLGWRNATPQLKANSRLVLILSVIGGGITYLFLLTDWFITGRYVLVLVLTWMIAVPIGCLKLVEFIRSRNVAWQRTASWLVMGLIILIFAVKGTLQLGDQKIQVPEASHWLQTHLQRNETIFSNNRQILYETKQEGPLWLQFRNNPPEQDLIVPDKIKSYDYAALEITRDEIPDVMKLMQSISFHLITAFYNRRGDAVLIFKHP